MSKVDVLELLLNAHDVVIANGPAKSGSTFLAQCMGETGYHVPAGSITRDGNFKARSKKINDGGEKICLHGNVPHPWWERFYGSIPTMTILRNPRNILVSRARWRRDLNQNVFGHDTLLGLLTDDRPHKGNLCDLEDFDAFRLNATVRYEDLCALSWGAIDVLAAFCGFDGDMGRAIKRQINRGHTWTGSPSNWRTRWSDDVEEAFQERGLGALCKRWGYLEEWNSG